ncbi:MAG: succinylglutamate desuccinylase/aspartoacylase family protein [Candidatus Cyclobacteriaceae bacterium M2_1C_046]
MPENNKIEVAGRRIAPGSKIQIDAELGKLPTRTPVEIPVFVNRAKEPGPVLLLIGGVHGDEINGIEIMRRIIRLGYNNPSKGTVICIPVFNVYGFLNQSRGLPDGRDLNRSFPGAVAGSLAGRIAHFFMEDVLPAVDYILDFHTGGARRNNYPQIRASFEDEKAKEMAKAFSAPFILNSPFREKSLRKSAFKGGKPTIVYEGGETLRLRKNVIDKGVNGTLRVLHYLGMRDEPGPIPSQESVFIPRSTWIRARRSGLHHAQVKNGEHVKKNQVIGVIADPYGDFEFKIKAPQDGYVIGINNYPVVNQGDPILHLGMPEDEK